MENPIIIELVLGRIEKHRIVRARIAAFSYGSLVLATLLLVLPVYNYLLAKATESGFSEYLSLFMSDWSSLAGSWRSLMISLIESVPIQGVVFMLGILFVFAFSANKLSKDFRLLKTLHI